MNKAILVLLVSLALPGLTGCGLFQLEDGSDFIEVSKVKYRKTSATDAKILYAGDKTWGFFRSYFEPRFAPILQGDITASQVTRITSVEQKKVAFRAAIEAGAKVADFDGSGGADSDAYLASEYVVFRVFDINKLVDELNSEVNRRYLEVLMRSSRPRVITSVIIIFNRRIAEEVNWDGKLELKVKKLSPSQPAPELTLNADGKKIKFEAVSDGTILAYEYSRVCWAKGKDKIRVFTLRADRPGFDGGCPERTDENANTL